jgi:hypothetical protein
MIGGTLLVILLFVSMTTWWLLAPGWAEWGALALMICAGIPHGSFDLRVAKAKWRDAPLSQKKIVALYLGGVVGMGGLCVFAPLIGLPLFLCISAIHFSEGEIHATTPPSNVAGTAYGVSAILLPIGLHVQEAQGYMGYFVPPEIFSSIEPPLVFVSYALALLLGILISASLISTKGTDRAEHLQRLICLGAWIILPPLSGFAVWFIGPIMSGAGLTAVILLIVGGVFYSVGGVLYGLKWPNPWPTTFGHHEFFHACTAVAAICHYIAMWFAVFW